MDGAPPNETSERCIVIRAVHVELAGSLNFAAVLAQVAYWSERSPEGWVRKTHAEWAAETFGAVSSRTARRALLGLQDQGVVVAREAATAKGRVLEYRLTPASAAKLARENPSERCLRVLPVHVEVAGSVAAAALLAQLAWWTGRGRLDGGWIFKSAEEWRSELFEALSVQAIHDIFKSLRLSEIVETRDNPESRWDRTRQYRLPKAVHSRLMGSRPKLEMVPAETGDGPGRNWRAIPETIPETTPETSNPPPQQIVDLERHRPSCTQHEDKTEEDGMSCNKLVVENDHDVMPLWQPPSAPQPYRPALPHDERAKSRALADHFQKRLGIPLAQGRAKWVAAFWTREEISTAIDSTAKANSPCWAYFARCLESANEKKPAATGGSNWNRTSAYEDDDDWVSAMRSRQKTKPMTLPASVQAQGWQ